MHGSYSFAKILKSQAIGKNLSWALTRYVRPVLKNILTLYSSQSLVINIGSDAKRAHYRESKVFDLDLNSKTLFSKELEANENVIARKKIELFLKRTSQSLFERIKLKLANA